MAGTFHTGHIVSFARLAWKVYQLGWAADLNATKQYTEFGRDVKGLAESLDLLTLVVSEASSSLRKHGAVNGVVRWDRVSFQQIVGDYDATLRECHDLVCSNEQYRRGSTPLRNIQFNVLIQPSVERLRQRIMLHNSKILHFLKPFEIDLLCRIRQDVDRMHRDLAYRITAVHNDLHRLIGVLIPDLDQALDQQAQSLVRLLNIPVDIAERLRYAALAERPECGNDECFELQDLSDAFILNYDKSIVNFTAGLLVTERIPPVDQYLNLLKCVWIFKRIAASPGLSNAEDSHWPSYTRQLENDLSSQCGRFGHDLVQPEFSIADLTPDMFSIWPETAQPQLVDVVTRDEIMEQVLEVPLQSGTSYVKRGLKLLRRQGSDGREWRIIIFGEEQTATTRRRQQTEVIDFDLASVVIDPLYALPLSNGATQEVILRRDERIARLTFTSMSHIMKFQQCITGFKPWASYCKYKAVVSFVVEGAKEPIEESACIQLWIPKYTAGSMTSTDLAAEKTDSPSVLSQVNRSAVRDTPLLYARRDVLDSASSFVNDAGRRSEYSSPVSSMGRHQSTTSASQQDGRSSNSFSVSKPFQSPPSPSLNTTPVIGPTSAWVGAQCHNQQRLGHSATLQLPSPSEFNSTSKSNAANGTHTNSKDRPLNVSSAGSSAVSKADTSITVSTGAHTTGILHRRPPKPMLVIFAENPRNLGRCIVSIQIDEETTINPARCNCRRVGRDGSACRIATIEQRDGDANLDARRYASPSRPSQDSDSSWNVAPVALDCCRASSNTAAATAVWPDLKRVSITFPHPEDRFKFGGTPNQCQCKIKTEGDLQNCLCMGHRGLLGEVHEFYRKQRNDYHKARYEGQQDVVHGLMS